MLILAFWNSPALARVDGKIVVGFSQIGAESAWRVANTKSVREAAERAGVTLILSDAQQKQENQIKAVKKFILQKVDVIVIAPVVSTGWEEVLLAAKEANIPVILVDREVKDMNSGLFVSFIGADFYEEGRRAALCLIDQSRKLKITGKIKIIELRGTVGSSPSILRNKGFTDVIAKNPQFRIVRSEVGDFKESIGKEWMQKIVASMPKPGSFNAVFAHNDNMALGAISAMDAAGLKPGRDIVVVSVDGIDQAFVAMRAGKLNCSVECSPLLGPQLMDAVQTLMSGGSISKLIITKAGVFPAEAASKYVGQRPY